MFNPQIKFEMSTITCNAEMKGNTKCNKNSSINAKKSCCIRIGPRNRAACAPICCSSRVSLPWVEELRYLGIFITRSRVFKILLGHAQNSFYRSANAIFGNVGRVANEDVVVQLLSSKCMPSLTYGLDACPLIKSDLSSLDFKKINRFFMKLSLNLSAVFQVRDAKHSLVKALRIVRQ